MADAMGATSKRLLDRRQTCVAVRHTRVRVARLLNHLMASSSLTGALAKSCSYYAPRHCSDEREQQDGKPLMHIRQNEL